MYRIKAVAEVSNTDDKLVWSGVLQEYIVDTWTDPGEGDEINVVMTWFKQGRTASSIPVTGVNVNAAVRLNAGSIVFRVPDYIAIDDVTNADQLQLAPCIVAATLNSSGSEAYAQVYDYSDRAEIVVTNLAGAHRLCCLDRQYFSFTPAQVVGNKVTINGILGVYGWVRGGYAVGVPPAVQYVGSTTVVTVRQVDALINRVMVGPVTPLTVSLPASTREIGMAAEFPFIAADSNGHTVPRRIIVDGGVTRLDVTQLTGEVQVMIPRWVDALHTYFGSPSLVIGPDPTDPVSVAEGITYIPPGTTVAYSVYGRDGNEWVIPGMYDSTTSTYKLWLALGTNVGANGMIAEGLVENLDWDFAVEDIGKPIYLATDGTWSIVVPTVEDNPGEAFRMLGWIESPTTIDFSGRIPGGMLENYS